jgi:Skp family chaperone for outer membrane proteins
MSIRIKYFALTAALFIALSFAFEQPAHAYVDPGSSLLVFQSLSAIVTGAVFYFRRRIKALFTRSSSSTTEETSE